MNRIFRFVLFAFLLVFGGCKQFELMSIAETKDGLVFRLPEEYAELRFFDIQVLKQDCVDDCIFWDAEVRVGDDGEPLFLALQERTLPYAKAHEDVLLRNPVKRLVPGSYRATGGFYRPAAKKGKVFAVNFEVERREDGVLVLKKE